MRESQISDTLVAALLEIFKVRFAVFHDRFGRNPRVDEPLFFDPSKDEPIEASQDDCRVQVLSAALASNVDAAAVLNFLGYEHIH